MKKLLIGLLALSSISAFAACEKQVRDLQKAISKLEDRANAAAYFLERTGVHFNGLGRHLEGYGRSMTGGELWSIGYDINKSGNNLKDSGQMLREDFSGYSDKINVNIESLQDCLSSR